MNNNKTLKKSDQDYFYKKDIQDSGDSIKYSFRRLFNPGDANHRPLKCDN